MRKIHQNCFGVAGFSLHRFNAFWHTLPSLLLGGLRRKGATPLLLILVLAACHGSGVPMGQSPDLGGLANIVTPPSLNCAASGMVQYGNTCVAPNVIPVACPTTSGEYKFISAFDPKEEKEAVDLSASLMPSPTKRFGGRIHAVAAYEGFKLWSYGSILFASDAAGKETTRELFSVINSIAVKKLADGTVFIAVGTRQNLQTFTLNISDGTLVPLAVFGKFGEITSVAIANSIDHIKQSILKNTQPLEGVDVSVNLPESKSAAASEASAIGAINATSDYIYIASAAGLHRIQPAMLGGGCVEEVWKPADASVRIVKIAAEENYVAALNETLTSGLAGLSQEDKNLYFKTMSNIKNADFAFAFNHLLWPDKVYRNAMTINLLDDTVSNHKSGIISDIEINGGNTYVSATVSDITTDWCTTGSCVQKASVDAITFLAGIKPLNSPQQIGTIYRYNMPSVSETKLDMPNTSVISPTGFKFLETWHPIFNRLASGTDGAYAWGSYGYIIKLKDAPELIPTNGFNAINTFLFPPLQIAVEQGADKLFGAFEADTETAALITSATAKQIATNGLKPLTIKTSSSDDLLFTNKIGAKMYVYSISGNAPKQVTDFSNMVNPVAFATRQPFSVSAQTTTTTAGQKSKFKITTVMEPAQSISSEFDMGEAGIYIRDIKIMPGKLLLLADKLLQNNTYKYFVYSVTYDAAANMKLSEPSSISLPLTSVTDPYFLIAIKIAQDSKMAFVFTPGVLLICPDKEKFPLLLQPLPNSVDAAADYVTDNGDEALGIALNADNSLILFSLTKAGVAPFPQSAISIDTNDKPISTKLVMSGQTAYLLANFSPTDQRLYKIKIQDNKLQIEQTYTGTAFRDIAMQNGKLVAASVDNGIEFYE